MVLNKLGYAVEDISKLTLTESEDLLNRVNYFIFREETLTTKEELISFLASLKQHIQGLRYREYYAEE